MRILKDQNTNAMPLNKVTSRHQLQFLNLEEIIDDASAVRVIDSYIKLLDPEELGFKIKGKSTEGRPAFAVSYLIGLYLYCYQNKIRSSRTIEKAAKLNIELWWLLDHQQPGYKTIADFRKENGQAMLNLFNHFRDFCIELDLFGKQVIAIDGSKIRGQNSKKNNYNKKKIERHQEYSETKIKEYLAQLDSNDLSELESKNIKEKLARANKSKAKYDRLNEQLKQSDEDQISSVDQDARALLIRRNIVEVGYNIQSSVDNKHKLIAHIDLTNKQDVNSLSDMAIKTQQAFKLEQADQLTVLADKGYYSGEEIRKCHIEGIDTLVAIPRNSNPKRHPDFTKDKFIYDEQRDVLICPAKKELTSTGKILSKKEKKRTVKYKRYSLDKQTCHSCIYKQDCLSEKSRGGKYLERSETEPALERNRKLVKEKPDLYRQRQAIVEHPFGTIKRNWGYDYTLLRGKQKVKGEIALIALCYNFKRAMNILGKEGLNNIIKDLIERISSIFRLLVTSTIMTHYDNQLCLK